jgi:hypothetical protein
MSDYAFSYDDLDSMISDASQGYDYSNINGLDLSGVDLGGINGLDLSGVDVSNINGLDLPGDFKIDSSAFSLDDIDSMLASAAGGTGDFDFSDLAQNVGDFDQAAPPANIAELLSSMDATSAENLANTDWNSLYNEGLTEEQIAARESLANYTGDRVQNFGDSVDMTKSMDDFSTNLQDIVDNRGGFTSQWQQVGSDRVMINDDGTGIGINENGDSYALSTKDVGSMIKGGQLNTSGSGYNTATGGNTIAPGGGSSVVLKDGKTGTLKTDGTVIDNKTGKVIGSDKDVKTVVTQDGDGKKITVDKTGTTTKTDTTKTDTTTKTGTGTGTGTKTTATNQSGLGSILPLLLALLAMNKGGGGGGGGGSGATIPGLTATQKQTPYAQQQRAPGYRPGQGGVTYFDQTQYAPKMAAGGIARLLKGPGDGVSDSIPAVIDEGMAGGGQPAKVARGEYIIDARTVAALGNGSTDAGAERLDKMRQNILRDDRKAGVGKDSKAYRHLLA